MELQFAHGLCRGVQLGDEGAQLVGLIALVLHNVGGSLAGKGLVIQLGLDALEVTLGLGLLLGDALELLKEKTEADFIDLPQTKPAAQRETPRHATYQEAKNHLESTVARWDKDSVVGILGQQITGACDTIRKLILSTPPEKRYGEIAPLFTKVLLYAHLCSDRAANGGEPGEMEKLLATGNSIRENIDSSTRQLATDPVFQELVLERIGGTEGAIPCPECAKFEKMILSGGCEPFWLEYKQRLKNLENQKEQPAAAKENQPVQQKQLDIPKITK